MSPPWRAELLWHALHRLLYPPHHPEELLGTLLHALLQHPEELLGILLHVLQHLRNSHLRNSWGLFCMPFFNTLRSSWGLYCMLMATCCMPITTQSNRKCIFPLQFILSGSGSYPTKLPTFDACRPAGKEKTDKRVVPDTDFDIFLQSLQDCCNPICQADWRSTMVNLCYYITAPSLALVSGTVELVLLE